MMNNKPYINIVKAQPQEEMPELQQPEEFCASDNKNPTDFSEGRIVHFMTSFALWITLAFVAGIILLLLATKII